MDLQNASRTRFSRRRLAASTFCVQAEEQRLAPRETRRRWALAVPNRIRGEWVLPLRRKQASVRDTAPGRTRNTGVPSRAVSPSEAVMSFIDPDGSFATTPSPPSRRSPPSARHTCRPSRPSTARAALHRTARANRDGLRALSLGLWQFDGARKPARRRAPRLPDARRAEAPVIAARRHARGGAGAPHTPAVAPGLALCPQRSAERADTDRESTVMRATRIDHDAAKYARP